MNNDECKLLVTACRNGDRRAFDELLSEFEKPVFNAVFRMLNNYEEARDVTQTVFMKAFEKLDQFDVSHKFFSWIYRIAINESINCQSARRHQVSLEPDLLEPDLQGPDNPEQDAAQNELHQGLLDALMTLSSEHRSVVVLKHFLGFSYDEISDILEIPEKTVKSRLHDGRERLRCRLDRGAYQ
jgi:RNA polymerase sigma-70 factor (ECF subfamily)